MISGNWFVLICYNWTTPCIFICDHVRFLKKGNINIIMFLKRFLSFGEKICTSVLATKTYGIEGFDVIFKKKGYQWHPFSYSIVRLKEHRFFVYVYSSVSFLWTFSVNTFFLRSRNVVPVPSKIRVCFYIDYVTIIFFKRRW